MTEFAKDLMTNELVETCRRQMRIQSKLFSLRIQSKKLNCEYYHSFSLAPCLNLSFNSFVHSFQWRKEKKRTKKVHTHCALVVRLPLFFWSPRPPSESLPFINECVCFQLAKVILFFMLFLWNSSWLNKRWTISTKFASKDFFLFLSPSLLLFMSLLFLTGNDAKLGDRSLPSSNEYFSWTTAQLVSFLQIMRQTNLVGTFFFTTHRLTFCFHNNLSLTSRRASPLLFFISAHQ